jgi:hypothetical protein
VCKVAATSLVLLWRGWPKRSALAAALSMAQVGEFTVLFAANAFRLGLLSRALYLATVVASVVMMAAVSPLLARTLRDGLGTASGGSLPRTEPVGRPARRTKETELPTLRPRDVVLPGVTGGTPPRSPGSPSRMRGRANARSGRAEP